MKASEVLGRLAGAEIPELRGVRAVYRFDIRGAGEWQVEVADGRATARAGFPPGAKEDCYIACDEEDFVEIACGRRRAMNMLMQGRIVFRGDIEYLVGAGYIFAAVTLKEAAERTGRATEVPR